MPRGVDTASSKQLNQTHLAQQRDFFLVLTNATRQIRTNFQRLLYSGQKSGCVGCSLLLVKINKGEIMPLEEIISEVKTREVTKRFTYSETEIKTLLGNKHNQAV